MLELFWVTLEVAVDGLYEEKEDEEEDSFESEMLVRGEEEEAVFESSING